MKHADNCIPLFFPVVYCIKRVCKSIYVLARVPALPGVRGNAIVSYNLSSRIHYEAWTRGIPSQLKMYQEESGCNTPRLVSVLVLSCGTPPRKVRVPRVPWASRRRFTFAIKATDDTTNSSEEWRTGKKGRQPFLGFFFSSFLSIAGDNPRRRETCGSFWSVFIIVVLPSSISLPCALFSASARRDIHVSFFG